MSRRLAREELFKLLFEAELNEVNPIIITGEYLAREEVDLGVKGKEFIEKYSKGISLHRDEILAVIDEKMTGWNFDRIGNIEKALLLFSVYELLFEGTPHEIVINETIELAKKYGDEKSHEFINGVLAKVVDGLEK
jgi:N utilization substance protein B